MQRRIVLLSLFSHQPLHHRKRKRRQSDTTQMQIPHQSPFFASSIMPFYLLFVLIDYHMIWCGVALFPLCRYRIALSLLCSHQLPYGLVQRCTTTSLSAPHRSTSSSFSSTVVLPKEEEEEERCDINIDASSDHDANTLSFCLLIIDVRIDIDRFNHISISLTITTTITHDAIVRYHNWDYLFIHHFCVIHVLSRVISFVDKTNNIRVN